MKLKLFLPLAIVVVSFLGALVIVVSKPDVRTEPPKTPAKIVKVVDAKKQRVQMKVHSQGTVVPRTEVALVSQVSGQVTQVSPSFVAGGFFKKGEPLVVLDKRDYEFAVTQAKSQVARAELALRIEEEQGNIAREEWRRLNDTEVPPLVAREPQFQEAKASLESAKATLELAKLKLERTTVRAPFVGRVRAKNVDVGQYVTLGVSLAIVYATDYAEVRLPLPDDDLAFLDVPFDFREVKSHANGQDVVLRARFAGGDQQWRGYISRLEAEVDPRSRMIHAVVRVKDPYGSHSNGTHLPLAVGLFVEAEIPGKTFEDIFVIPRSAVRDGNMVLVVDDEGRLRFRELDVLRLDAERAYIRSGLTDGDRVCISPPEAVVEGMRVTPLYE